MDWLTTPDGWIALLTLTALEIVLGVDNIIFISILAGKLPPAQQNRARIIGLSLAMLTRIALLFSLNWVIGLTEPLFAVLDHDVSGRDLILLGGGLFLLFKATFEIHENLEGAGGHGAGRAAASFGSVIVQILLLDIVFSLDSVITAVDMADDIEVMVAAVVAAVLVMLVSSGAISAFVERHPTVKMLALSFLVLIGASLIAEGFEYHIPKGYIYGPIAFSILVEALNLRARSRQVEEPVHLRSAYVKEGEGTMPAPVPADGVARDGAARREGRASR